MELIDFLSAKSFVLDIETVQRMLIDLPLPAPEIDLGGISNLAAKLNPMIGETSGDARITNAIKAACRAFFTDLNMKLEDVKATIENLKANREEIIKILDTEYK